VIAGSPHYLAPEQLDGGPVDARSDIYSLGVVLYELLAGHKAFRGDSLEQIHAAVRAGQVTLLHELQPSVPRALADITARAMAREPDRRFASASELAQALRQWAATVAATGTPVADPVAPEVEVPVRSRGRIRGAVTALALAAMATAGVLLGARPESGQARPPAVPLAAVTVPAAAAAAAQPAPSPTAAKDAAAAAGARPAAVATAAAPGPAGKAAVRNPAPQPRATPAAAERTPAAPSASGTLQMAISPWGEVEVDGRPAGTTPPLTQLNLPEGAHVVTIRNADFPPYTATVQVQAGQPVTVRHRFGS
jgi:serine/threonine-protein kinase